MGASTYATSSGPAGSTDLRATGARTQDGVVTVFVVDDHPVVRQGVRTVLETAPDLLVIGDADNRLDGLAGIIELRPALALVDVRMPGGDGIDVVREVRSRRLDTVCLMLTSFADETAFFQSVVAGAVGYLVKGCTPSELLAACRRAARGESLIERSVLDDLRRQATRLPDDAAFLSNLTPQERRILGFVTEGLTNGEIADRLDLAEKTVRNYVSTVLGKMGMKNRTQAAAYVARSLAMHGEGGL
ncbi:MAG: response regulator transcription factor [Nitriliruptorales bacterium]|nr:response regulator transcription factor [Nitriliruptorales bacterium]